MSNYPDGCQFPKEPTDAEQWEADQADEALQEIIDYKRDLLEFLNTKRGSLKAIAAHMRREMEECFDEAFYKEWQRLAHISCSIGWPAEIPPFEMLSFETPKQKADREWRNRLIRKISEPSVKAVEASIADIFGGNHA